MGEIETYLAERGAAQREFATTLRDTDGVAHVYHLPAPDTPSGYTEMEVLVKADAYGDAPPRVLAAVADSDLSLPRPRQYDHPDYRLVVVR